MALLVDCEAEPREKKCIFLLSKHRKSWQPDRGERRPSICSSGREKRLWPGWGRSLLCSGRTSQGTHWPKQTRIIRTGLAVPRDYERKPVLLPHISSCFWDLVQIPASRLSCSKGKRPWSRAVGCLRSLTFRAVRHVPHRWPWQPSPGSVSRPRG